MTDDTYFSEYNDMKYVEWKINKFFDLPVTDRYCLDSPQFSHFGANWYLKVYTSGREALNAVGWISIYLYKNYSALERHVTFRMGIKAADGSELHVKNFIYLFPKRYLGYGTSNLVERSILKTSKDSSILDGTLTFFCAIRIGDQEPAPLDVKHQTSVIATEGTSSLLSSSDGISTLIDNFKESYINRRYTDITIVVKKKEFLTHKFVLAARSTVFASMFDHDMVEKNSGRVEISDCDPDSFEQFLLFLYTGKFDVVSAINAVTLYETAEKYDIQDLKEKCRQCLTHELSVDTFCEVFCLAFRQNDQDLLKSVTDFFVNNTKNILHTTKWQTLIVEQPLLCNELLLKFFNK